MQTSWKLERCHKPKDSHSSLLSNEHHMQGDRLDKQKQKQLHVIHYNTRSLCPKLDELRACCVLDKPDIVCTETWLCDDIVPLECSITGYHCVRYDRHRHGGGVAMFLSDKLESHVVLCDLEFLLVSVHNANNVRQKVHIGLWYRLLDNYAVLDNSLLENLDISVFLITPRLRMRRAG